MKRKNAVICHCHRLELVFYETGFNRFFPLRCFSVLAQKANGYTMVLAEELLLMFTFLALSSLLFGVK